MQRCFLSSAILATLPLVLLGGSALGQNVTTTPIPDSDRSITSSGTSPWMAASAQIPPASLLIPGSGNHGYAPQHITVRSPNASSAKNRRPMSTQLVDKFADQVERKLQTPPPSIPYSQRQTTWKTPYAYGYFGASGKRHWSKHHGYRDRVTQWTLR
ncbi:MAG: hypothetical protein AAF989_16795 [Planctomycetota bacterium]